MSSPWNAHRILTELCDPSIRKEILTSFWKGADEQTRRLTIAQLAKALRFRPETVRKANPERRAEWLALRLHSPELEESLTLSLMIFHTTERKELMAAFLDAWGIPHVDGAIEEDEYRTPLEADVRAAAAALAERFTRNDIVLYLASAGLLMGEGWRSATWPVVDELHR